MNVEELKISQNEQNQDVSIKDLNLKDQNRKTLIAKEKQYINHITGEVLGSESYSIQVKTKDEFVKLFVENIDYLGKKLDGFEFKTLFFILKKMDYQNSLVIDSTFKKNLSICFDNKSSSVISRAISGLISKNILLKIDTMELRQKFQSFIGNSYYVNPNIIGKGSFRDIKKLRQTIITDFDFENNMVTKSASIDTTYDEGQELIDNTQKYEIDNVEIINNTNTNEKIANILVSEKEEEDKNDDINFELAQIELEEAKLKLKKATLLKQYGVSDS
ncbi:hypothetical protein [Helicobacter ganmani]|uniref:hypothetical protein n=1 Tax=Helicobacter ganmani TaxID=60246 RepID=UPI003A89333E